jgi:hypothetical protein
MVKFGNELKGTNLEGLESHLSRADRDLRVAGLSDISWVPKTIMGIPFKDYADRVRDVVTGGAKTRLKGSTKELKEEYSEKVALKSEGQEVLGLTGDEKVTGLYGQKIELEGRIEELYELRAQFKSWIDTRSVSLDLLKTEIDKRKPGNIMGANELKVKKVRYEVSLRDYHNNYRLAGERIKYHDRILTRCRDAIAVMELIDDKLQEYLNELAIEIENTSMDNKELDIAERFAQSIPQTGEMLKKHDDLTRAFEKKDEERLRQITNVVNLDIKSRDRKPRTRITHDYQKNKENKEDANEQCIEVIMTKIRES